MSSIVLIGIDVGASEMQVMALRDEREKDALSVQDVEKIAGKLATAAEMAPDAVQVLEILTEQEYDDYLAQQAEKQAAEEQEMEKCHALQEQALSIIFNLGYTECAARTDADVRSNVTHYEKVTDDGAKMRLSLYWAMWVDVCRDGDAEPVQSVEVGDFIAQHKDFAGPQMG